ncbi:MAG: hypothetical protein IPL73_30965 [Candidatus Obscuribacter sp.]|nr:hypothetical protein [Candidatus Obscuribacter sp.]
MSTRLENNPRSLSRIDLPPATVQELADNDLVSKVDDLLPRLSQAGLCGDQKRLSSGLKTLI